MSPIRVPALITLFALSACRDTPDAATGDDGVGTDPDGVVLPDADQDGSPDAQDCDDEDPDVFPGADEFCNGRDDDCDGRTDELPVVDGRSWFADTDGDGYGDPAVSTWACTAPDGMIADATDCDDRNPDVSPGEDEVCNGVDDDCDRDIDEDSAVDAPAWFLDLDGDGHGLDDVSLTACAPPGDLFTAVGGDCDDTDALTHPGAPNRCDAVDRDCDGDLADDGDADGDGFADQACGGADCDDDDALVVPDTSGVCADGTSCLGILLADPTAADGLYLLDPDGPSQGEAPFETWCDMTTDGGGWTLVGTVANDGTRRWDALDAFVVASSVGSPLTYQGSDYRNPGLATLPATDLLVRTDEYHIGWLDLLGSTSFGAWILAEYDATQCSTEFVGGTPALASGNLSAAQVALHDVVVRALDTNAACFPGNHENALISFTLSDCCWTNGLGNPPRPARDGPTTTCRC